MTLPSTLPWAGHFVGINLRIRDTSKADFFVSAISHEDHIVVLGLCGVIVTFQELIICVCTR